MESIQQPSAVGVDPHVDTLTAAAIDPAGKVLWDMTVPNTTAGIDALTTRINGHGVVWAIEGTGSFGRALCDRLLDAGAEVREVPTRLTGRLRTRAGYSKTDRGDAAAIGRAALTEPLAEVSHHRIQQTLRVGVRQREALVQSQVRALNRIRARLRELDPDKARQLKRIRSKATLESLTGYATTQTSDPYRGALELAISIDATNCLARRQQIRDLETVIKGTLPEAGEALMAITGIGFIGAATIIAATGNIERFPTEGHYGRYCGTAPLDASSGRQQRHRLNRWGSRALNRVFRTAIVTQLQRKTEGHAYVTRRISEGKTKTEAMRACQRHLNKRVYRLLKSHPLT